MPDVMKKIKEVLSKPQVASLATITERGNPWVRYVMVLPGEGDTIWVATSLASRKADQIRKNPHVHLLCGVTSPEAAERWLQIEGEAEVSTDDAVRRACWYDQLANFFKGPDDPGYVVVVIRPSRIEYQTMGSMQPEIWVA